MKKIIALLVVAIVLLAGFAYYQLMVVPVVPKDSEAPIVVQFPTGSSYEQVMDSLAVRGIRPNRTFFDPLANRMRFRREPMRAGRFSLPPGTSAIGLIRRLRSGAQATVDVVLTTEREPMNVAAKVARFLEPDSLAFWRLFQDTVFVDSIGYTPETLQTLFIPNTYEMYWNATPREFVARMVKEHERFWRANDRLDKAAAVGLSPAEVYTLASIVEKESLQAVERPRIAGVYLNRLRIGMPLQADPTAVFATREFDVGRVLHRHIEFDSPYNTYRYPGLPPGPITMSSAGSIDAVLSPEEHNFLYFCARGDGSGLHNFASTLAGHSRNIAIYVANLKARGIR
ncbi:endolytic transglycosylase MltG [Lewinella sp. JB7]|uniref:endolytic transglycosylase MltG n=1 Tax=Lewinella sp. JB7 TaxID=2962887 RepID=UPI0020C996A1|nr:endolytic transglycosylase MltG [Lewinella sp. JB7]MCP9236860.1 endolytic transglycosylase MltG [Lewinella sp. JB7]